MPAECVFLSGTMAESSYKVLLSLGWRVAMRRQRMESSPPEYISSRITAGFGSLGAWLDQARVQASRVWAGARRGVGVVEVERFVIAMEPLEQEVTIVEGKLGWGCQARERERRFGAKIWRVRFIAI